MSRKLLSALALSLLSSFASAAELPAIAAVDSENFRVVIDATLMNIADDAERREVLAAWMLYAAARAQTYDKLAAAGRRNPAIADFAIELAGRNALATAWASRGNGEAAANAYLDKLVEIQQRGFMEEYVMYFYLQPGWTVSPAALAQIDFPAFAEWGNANGVGAVDHPTLIGLESLVDARPQVSVQPGATLPDPARFAATSASCSASTAALNAAGAQWAEESKSLDGAPVAAADRNEFIYVLNAQRSAEPFRTRGITWVSDRPGRLTYLAGFCAVEEENLLDAMWWLNMAKALRPMDFSVQAELVHVMIFMRQFDEADAQIQQIMDASQDPCDLAGMWRRRGYIRFEEGDLDASRSAYLKSLEYDPENPLALAELRLIDQTLLQDDDVVAATPPPPSETTIQTCQRR